MNSKEWISEWNNLFPSNIKWNGVNIKSRDEDCEKRMNDFLKRYPEYSKETIFKATKTYLEKQKNENWNYTKRSDTSIFIDPQRYEISASIRFDSINSM